jgi:hypothetical protein
LQNKRFIWSNERVEPTQVRLDWVFCNKDWELNFSGYVLHALSSSLSDQCPFFPSQQNKVRVIYTFRIKNFWPMIPGFLDTIKEAWQTQVPDISPLNILYYNLQHIVVALKNGARRFLAMLD